MSAFCNHFISTVNLCENDDLKLEVPTFKISVFDACIKGVQSISTFMTSMKFTEYLYSILSATTEYMFVFI